MVQQSSSDDSSSDSDDEMRSRLMETVVTVEQIKRDEKKKGFGSNQSNNYPGVLNTYMGNRPKRKIRI